MHFILLTAAFAVLSAAILAIMPLDADDEEDSGYYLASTHV